MVRIPTHGPPTHPGEMLLEEFLKPLGLSQTDLAEKLGVSYPRVNELIHGKRSVTPDTALRLEQLFGMEAQSWLNLQPAWDLYHASWLAWRSRRGSAFGGFPYRVPVQQLEPLQQAGRTPDAHGIRPLCQTLLPSRRFPCRLGGDHFYSSLSFRKSAAQIGGPGGSPSVPGHSQPPAGYPATGSGCRRLRKQTVGVEVAGGQRSGQGCPFPFRG